MEILPTIQIKANVSYPRHLERFLNLRSFFALKVDFFQLLTYIVGGMNQCPN